MEVDSVDGVLFVPDDMFWIVIPLVSLEGVPLFNEKDREAELSVRIYNKVGRVHWEVPASVRRIIAGLSASGKTAAESGAFAATNERGL